MNYDKRDKIVNNGIRNGNAGELKNNKAVGNYAYDKYREMGLNNQQAHAHIDRKCAGHIYGQPHGGKK